MSSKEQAAMHNIKEASLGAYFRPKDLAPIGLSFANLQALVSKGLVEKVSPGLYHLAGSDVSEQETLALVARAVPAGIICLLSALGFHGIGTQAPYDVWLALDRKARKPEHLPAKVHIVRFSGAMLTYGVKSEIIQGVSARITSPARTVVDCFRYRNKLGLDIPIEALREVLRSRLATADEIMRAAEVCHARTIIRPYLEALTS